MDRAVDGDEGRPRAENLAAAADLHGRAAARLRGGRESRGAGEDRRAAGAAPETPSARGVARSDPPVSRWKLTVRHGSDVDHLGFDDLGEAVAAMRARALEIRAEGPVKG